MKVIDLPTLICGNCGNQLRPESDPISGTVVVYRGASIWVKHYHGPNVTCPDHEKVIAVDLLDFTPRVIGKMDYSRLPAKMKPL